MSEETYREIVTSRFGEEATIAYEPLEDAADARTGTRVVIRIPLETDASFRQAQFMRVAEMTGGHDWELADEDDALRLEIETQYKLPERFEEEPDAAGPQSTHAAYVESLTGAFGGAVPNPSADSDD